MVVVHLPGVALGKAEVLAFHVERAVMQAVTPFGRGVADPAHLEAANRLEGQRFGAIGPFDRQRAALGPAGTLLKRRGHFAVAVKQCCGIGAVGSDHRTGVPLVALGIGVDVEEHAAIREIDRGPLPEEARYHAVAVRLLVARPDHPQALALKNKLEVEAIAAYRRALVLTPDHTQARINLATMLYGRGERDEARRLVEEVLRTSPDDAGARRLLQQWNAAPSLSAPQ